MTTLSGVVTFGDSQRASRYPLTGVAVVGEGEGGGAGPAVAHGAHGRQRRVRLRPLGPDIDGRLGSAPARRVVLGPVLLPMGTWGGTRDSGVWVGPPTSLSLGIQRGPVTQNALVSPQTRTRVTFPTQSSLIF